MSFVFPTNASQVQAFAGALYGVQVGTTTMAQVNADIAANGGLASTLNSYYSATFGGVATSTVAATVAANLGLTGDALASGTAYVEAQLNAAAAGARGAVISSIVNLFGTLSADATFGAAATAWNAKVATAAAYTGAANVAVGTEVTTGSVFTLTTGVDTLTGTASNDTFNAVQNATTGAVLGGLDVLVGGAGDDTLNVSDTQGTGAFTFGGASITGIETVNVTTNGDFTGLNISAMTGVTQFNGAAADADAATVTAAATQNVSLNLGTTNNSTVTGGKVVSVTKTDTAAGTLGVTGSALTAVNIKDGAGVVTVNNTSAAGANNAGTTLTTVTLDSVNANANIGGAALTTLNLSGATSDTRTTTITNATASHGFTINATGAGIDSASLTSAFLAGGAVVTDSVATSLVINSATTKNSLNVAGFAAATKVTITGDAALTLIAAPAASVKNIDGSAATGALTLGTLNAAVVTLSGGAGKDTATLAATTKATVAMGAGDDTLTLGAVLAAGSTVDLGAGNDKLLGSSLPATSLAATSVIDGGDGTDSLAIGLVNAGNAALFKNFENLSVSSDNVTLDASLISGITGLSIDAAAAAPVLTGLTQAQSLTNNFVGDNSANTTTLTFSATNVAGTADSYNITFAGAAQTTVPTAANALAGTIAAAGIENFNIASTSAANTWNSITLGADTSARTVVVTGAQNLDLAFAANFGQVDATNGTTGVSSIDGSAATGKLAINLTNVVSATAGTAVMGGSAADTITTKAAGTQTLTGGAGNDTFVVAASTGVAPIVTIADLTVGDKIDLAGTIAAAGTLGAKKDVGAAVTLATALEIANGADGTLTTAALSWFQYGGNTYVYSDLPTAGPVSGTLDATDNIVKITGLVDLSTSTFTTGAILTVVAV